MDKIKFKNDSDDQYEPTDSEEEYSEEEKELLEDVRKGKKRDVSKKREVLAFAESEDDDDEEAEEAEDDEDDDMGLADSDIEGAEVNDDDLPDTKYWGKKKSSFYNTDFVDPDYSSYNEKEEELAKFEEEEAKTAQHRLTKEINVLELRSDKLKKSKKADQTNDSLQKEPLLKVDISELSKSERLKLFEKDSPEFSGFMGDFEVYLEEIQQLHNPVLRYVNENQGNMIPALQFAQHYQNLALTYCSHVAFYLLLKAKRISIENHPVLQRLSQLKKLLTELDDKHENIIKPQLEALLERIQDGDRFEILDLKNVPPPLEEEAEKPKKRKTKLGILSTYDNGEASAESPTMKKIKMETNEEGDKDFDALAELSSDDNDSDDVEEMGEEEEDGNDGETRRGITYQIAKNKGLMPHRNKEQRNPRVKHRGKYRKALIRRKGAVRTVRKEFSRYGGEISGIKATVSKSIKFRT